MIAAGGGLSPKPAPLWGPGSSGSLKPGTNRSAMLRDGTCASSWQEIATIDAITRIGIASFGGMSICRAALI